MITISRSCMLVHALDHRYLHVMLRPLRVPYRAHSPFLSCAMASLVSLFYRIPFTVLEVPPIKLKKPSFVKAPSALVVFCGVLFSYFLVTGGLIYDVIVEPPSIGSQTDEYGHSRPVAFMQYRVNGQYIMEGLASSFMFTLGALGFIILERSNAVGLSKLNRTMLLAFGIFCVIAAFIACRVFMSMKLPYVCYLYFYLEHISYKHFCFHNYRGYLK